MTHMTVRNFYLENKLKQKLRLEGYNEIMIEGGMKIWLLYFNWGGYTDGSQQ